MRRPIRIVLAVAALGAAGLRAAPAPEGAVLVVGDGISVELLTAARIYKHGAQGRLDLERLPYTAFVRTWSANSMVTDSSSAATALARGIKAVNGRVGIPEAGAPGPASLLDIARARGWSTGVVTDDSVTGGTPASFFVEDDARKAYPRIASKTVPQLGPRLDLLLGGGRAYFRESNDPAVLPADADLLRATASALAARQADGTLRVYTEWEAFASRKRGAADAAPVLGLFADDTFSYVADGPRTPALLDLVQEAIAELRAKGRPFLLIVEAGLADKAAHMNEGMRALNEVLEMDAVIGWLDQHLPPGVTLLATTDHGTGGAAINGYLPLRASGNTLFLANPSNGLPILSWATGPGGAKEGEPAPTRARKPEELQPGSRQAGAAYTGSAMHTGGDVWLIGRGPGSEQVRGFLDNTDVFRILKSAIESGAPAAPPARGER